MRALRWLAGLAGAALLTLAGGVGSSSARPAVDYRTPGAQVPRILQAGLPGVSFAHPARGTLYVCSGGRLSLNGDNPWVVRHGTAIDLSKRPFVAGEAHWKSVFSVTTDGPWRHFTGNGLPDHPTGVFPVPQGTAAYQYYVQGNGGSLSSAAAFPIVAYHLDYSVPLRPEVAAHPSCLGDITIGVALTGATFHDSVSVEFKDPQVELPLDQCFGHPDPFGRYHYHAPAFPCFAQGNRHGPSPLVGYALDGFGIYGPRGTDGRPVTNAQLDECHGLVSKVMWDGRLTRIYHYVLNSQYPYNIGCFRGTPHY